MGHTHELGPGVDTGDVMREAVHKLARKTPVHPIDRAGDGIALLHLVEARALGAQGPLGGHQKASRKHEGGRVRQVHPGRRT